MIRAGSPRLPATPAGTDGAASGERPRSAAKLARTTTAGSSRLCAACGSAFCGQRQWRVRDARDVANAAAWRCWPAAGRDSTQLGASALPRRRGDADRSRLGAAASYGARPPEAPDAARRCVGTYAVVTWRRSRWGGAREPWPPGRRGQLRWASPATRQPAWAAEPPRGSQVPLVRALRSAARRQWVAGDDDRRFGDDRRLGDDRRRPATGSGLRAGSKPSGST